MKRTGFIGGSDCVKIMQGEWLELWQIKTGRAESADLSNNLAVQLGIWTENFNLQWFETQYDVVLHGHQYEFEQNIGGIPSKGTVDAMLRGAHISKTEKAGLSIVEAKHTNSYNTMEKAVQYYMPQLQLYMHLANADSAYLSVIFGNNNWEAAHVKYNEEYFNSMWAVVADFWGYVCRDQEPVGIETPSISQLAISVDDMVVRDASKDNAFVDAAHTYLENQLAAKLFESAKKDLKAMIGDNEREVFCDQLSVKRNKAGSLMIRERK